MKERLAQIIPFTGDHPKTLLDLSPSVLGIVQKAEEALSACIGINLDAQHLPNYRLLFLSCKDFCKFLLNLLLLSLSDVAQVGQCLQKLPAAGWLRNGGFVPATLTETVKPSWDLTCKLLSKSGHPPV